LLVDTEPDLTGEETEIPERKDKERWLSWLEKKENI